MRWSLALALLTLFAVGRTSTGEVPDLSGRWAMVQVYPEIATLPFVGDVARVSVVAQFVTVLQTGSNVVMTDVYCFTDVSDGTPLVQTRIPATFIAALSPHPREAALVAADGGRVRFVQQEYVEVRGARLSDASEPLPRDPGDPRVLDPDADGHPGLTVQVQLLGLVEGETYVVQRVRVSLDGIVMSENAVRGLVTWSTEQVTLGASSDLLNVQAAGRPDPDPLRHVFAMVRVDDTWTCETLREQVDGLVAFARSE